MPRAVGAEPLIWGGTVLASARPGDPDRLTVLIRRCHQEMKIDRERA
jgi:hypothetical protein